MEKVNGWKTLGFETYEDYLLSEIWESKKNFMIKLKKCCKNCKSTDNLNVHHKTYLNVGNEKEDDLEVLCITCHKRIHGK